MKQLLVLSAFAASSVFATTPILTKVTSNGPISPIYQQRTTCKVFANKVEITHNAGGVTAVTSAPVTLSNNIENLVTDASKGTITHGKPPVGGPVTIWTANHSVRGTMTEVELKAEGGVLTENGSDAVHPLVNLLDLLCK
jgi:hypothetical protein